MKEKLKLGKRKIQVKKPKKEKILRIINNMVSILILVLGIGIFCLSFYIEKFLSKVSFYEIVYYLISPKTGFGSSVFYEGVKACAGLFISLLIILLIPIINSKRVKISLQIRNKDIKLYPVFYKYKFVYSLIVLAMSAVFIMFKLGAHTYIKNNLTSGDIYETSYVNTNEVKIKFPEKKKNLIILYLESMEASLVSPENGGVFSKSRIPELEKLALDNISFSNTDKLGGGNVASNATWTIAATVASTSGTPVLSDIGNSYDKIEKFMPNVITLGDVLNKEGYNLELIQGTGKYFAGTDKYYITHGNYEILDYYEMIDRELVPEGYYVWEGVEDKKVLEFSKDEILKLAEEDKPFSVSIFTMDTHFKDGYVDSSCSNKFSEHLSNAYACSSKMVNEFINWLKKQDFYKNTTIVLIGDHLNMNTNYFSEYPEYNRTIYNTFINSSVTDVSHTKNRLFSSYDLYPTILASVGAEIEGDKIGFGVNLFSGKKTMFEELGINEFNTELLKRSTYYSKYITNYTEIGKLNEEKNSKNNVKD